jgi:hypothetical protein
VGGDINLYNIIYWIFIDSFSVDSDFFLIPTPLLPPHTHLTVAREEYFAVNQDFCIVLEEYSLRFFLFFFY